MPRRNPWPLLIVVLIVGFLALTAWSFQRAAREASAVTDSDYYHHGLRFEQTRLEQHAAAALGWQATPQLAGRILTIGLLDRSRQAVTNASGSLTLLQPGKDQARELALHEVAPGSYRAELPADLHGEQIADLAFQRDEARLTTRLLFVAR